MDFLGRQAPRGAPGPTGAARLCAVRRASPILLAALAASCVARASLPAAEAERIHGVCRERIASGQTLTARRGDLGSLPPGAETRDRVVIYGAAWCTACHIAADYLSRFDIPYVELDVEEDDWARARRDRTLELASLPPHRSLPVIEVRGTVMIGFMPCVLEAAWRG